MKFIHLADVHLGAVPERGSSLGELREGEIWDTFRRVFTYIRENPVDLLFIAGDLFHAQPLNRELKEVNYLFSSIPATRIFLMAGNHDYLKKESFYRGYLWSENVVFFDEKTVKCVKADGQEVYVYGNSYESREIPEPIYQGITRGMDSGFHVLMAHGGDADHAPIDFRALSVAGFDYVALGHIHKPQVLLDNKIAYAGSLEPLDRNETGEHGFIEGTFENGKTEIAFVPFASRSYKKIAIQIHEDTTQYDLEDRMKKVFMKYGEQNIYQITLKGRRAADMFFLPERLLEMGHVIEVKDETRPAYQLGELERQYSGTLVGSYIAAFREKEELTEVEEKALYYGLQALLETTNNGYQAIGNPKLRKTQ